MPSKYSPGITRREFVATSAGALAATRLIANHDSSNADRQAGLAKPIPELQIDQLLVGIARILRLALGTGFRRNLRTVVSFVA